MTKIAKFIRTVSVAPISAIIISIIVYFLVPNSYNNVLELLLMTSILGIIPILSYPLQHFLHIIKGEDERNNERKLAFIFSIGGYVIGLLISIFFNISSIQKLLYLTYFFSGLILAVFNYLLRVRASGHMCGISGPIALSIYLFGWKYTAIFALILFLVGWSSVKLKRHKYTELFFGFLVPILAMLISLAIVY